MIRLSPLLQTQIYQGNMELLSMCGAIIRSLMRYVIMVDDQDFNLFGKGEAIQCRVCQLHQTTFTPTY